MSLANSSSDPWKEKPRLRMAPDSFLRAIQSSIPNESRFSHWEYEVTLCIR